MLLFISLLTLLCALWSLFLCVTTLVDILTTAKKIEQQRKEDEEFARFVKQARAISNFLIGPIASETIIIKK